MSFQLNAWQHHFNYMPFFTELQSSLDWWHFLTFTWIVIRNDLMVDFSEKLRKKMHSQDFLLVLPAVGPASGWLPKDAWDWLGTRVPRVW